MNILSCGFNPIRSKLETVLDFWVVNVCMKEFELIKGNMGKTMKKWTGYRIYEIDLRPQNTKNTNITIRTAKDRKRICRRTKDLLRPDPREPGLPRAGSLQRLQRRLGARSIQSNYPEISVQNSMDRFGPTGKVSKKRVHLLRWTTFPGRTGWNFGWMDRALDLGTLGAR